MKISSVLQHLKDRVWPNHGGRALRRKPNRQRRKAHLCCERLEDRALLATFTVFNLNDSGPGSLRQVISAANDAVGADLIRFTDNLHGTITLTTGELSISDDLTIGGNDGDQKRIIISGNDASRVFHIGGASVTIAHLTITDGVAEIGAGILNEADASLTVRNCTLRNNNSVGST